MAHYTQRLVLQGKGCLVMQPKLVKTLGKSAALILQQIHYWLSASKYGKSHDGKKWIYNTYEKWAEQISIYSVSTIRRAIAKLEQEGLIEGRFLSDKKSDRTKWYTINYKALNLHENEENKGTCVISPSVKMDTPPVQNEQMYIDTKITSKNQTLLKNTQQGPLENLKNERGEGGRPLAWKLINIWNEEVGARTGCEAALTKNRAMFLIKAFHAKFGACLTTWRAFCKSLTHSDFLMGRIRETFKVTLDWVLKFETLQRIFEGQYGVNFQGNKPVKSDVLQEEDENIDHPTLRKIIREKVGEGAYLSWFRRARFTHTENAITLIMQTKFQADYIERAFFIDLEKSFGNYTLSIQCEK